MESYFSRDAVGDLGGQLRMVPNPDRVATINYACANYGFLINRNETIPPAEFIARIRKVYDCETIPQNRAVVDALAHLI